MTLLKSILLSDLLALGLAAAEPNDQDEHPDNPGWCFTIELHEDLPNGFSYEEHDCEKEITP